MVHLDSLNDMFIESKLYKKKYGVTEKDTPYNYLILQY